MVPLRRGDIFRTTHFKALTAIICGLILTASASAKPCPNKASLTYYLEKFGIGNSCTIGQVTLSDFRSDSTIDPKIQVRTEDNITGTTLIFYGFDDVTRAVDIKLLYTVYVGPEGSRKIPGVAVRMEGIGTPNVGQKGDV
jgi:hypothetical protein